MSRRPDPRESAIIGRLLEAPFPGRDEVRLQIESARVRDLDEEYEDQYGSLVFEVPDPTKAPVLYRVPVEADALDSDGVPIEILLHVVDGVVDELEIFKADGSPIVKPPQAADLTIRVLPIA